jgi:hypothetical protein
MEILIERSLQQIRINIKHDTIAPTWEDVCQSFLISSGLPFCAGYGYILWMTMTSVDLLIWAIFVLMSCLWFHTWLSDMRERMLQKDLQDTVLMSCLWCHAWLSDMRGCCRRIFKVLCFSVSIWLTMENSKAAGFKTLNHSKMLPIWQIAHLSHYHRKKKKPYKRMWFLHFGIH